MRSMQAMVALITLLAVALAVRPASADVVVDMPAPPPPRTDSSDPIVDAAEPGEVAITRYAEARGTPRDTYGGWGSSGFGFHGWGGYGWGGYGWGGWGCGYRLSIFPWGGGCGFPVFAGSVRIGTSF